MLRELTVCICAILSATSASVAGVEPKNYLYNGGFECVTNPALPDGWSPLPNFGLRYMPEFCQPSIVLNSYRLIDENPRSGRWALEISPLAGGRSGRAISAVTWLPSHQAEAEPLYLTAWCRSDSASSVQVEPVSGNGNPMMKGVFLLGPTWRRIIMKIPVQSPMGVRFSTTPAGGSVVIDDVMVTFGLPKEESGIAAATGQPSVPLEPEPGEEVPEVRPKKLVCALGLGKTCTPEVLTEIAQIDANAVVLRHWMVTEQVLSEASRLGLRVIVWCRGPEPLEAFRKYSTRPEIMAWIVYDEPNQPTGQWAKETLAPYRQINPSVTLFINHFWDKPQREDFPEIAGDILSADDYPCGRSPVSSLLPWYGALGRHSLASGKPAWAWVQITGYTYNYYREPTPREWRAMAYAALASGLRGMMYWENRPFSESLWQTVKRVHHELADIEDFLFDPAKTVDANWSHLSGKESTVVCTCRELGGQKLLVVVNTDTGEVVGKLSSAGLPVNGQLRGRFGTSSTSCSKGVVKLKLPPMSVSVWQW